jgi:hypothetical protein
MTNPGKLEAELAAARSLLAKATEFRGGAWVVQRRKNDWRTIAWNIERSLEETTHWLTAAEAVAAAEKAKGEV